METKTFRIGTGAGFSADRLDPAIDLVRRGGLNAIVFECLGERTLAAGLRDKLTNPTLGYNPLLGIRMRAILPLCRANNTSLITNMGAANPLTAGKLVANIARDLGLKGTRIAVVTGDDVSAMLSGETHIVEQGCTINELARTVFGANAYLGTEGIVEALTQNCDVVITGRVADPSLFLAPLQHFFQWKHDDWSRASAGTMIGHLMECAAQVTGGYYADPGYKDVDNLSTVGFPIAEVQSDGTGIITKLPGTGGRIDLRTVKEQLLYEVHNPTKYSTPDVVADFSSAHLRLHDENVVSISGAKGTERPHQLKVTVAFDGGFLGEAELSYAGPGAEKRGRMANEIVDERMRRVHGIQAALRCDLVGVSSLHPVINQPDGNGQDVRIRCAIRTPDRKQAETLLWEVESLLCCGPAGGGGYRGNIESSVLTYSTFMDRDRISPRLEIFCV